MTTPEQSCFEWQNRCSDFLDGHLVASEKLLADRHLDQCKACGERLVRYRKILSSLSARPRHTIPVPIRKSPLAFVFPKIDLTPRLSRWEQTPWFIRSGVEGLGIALIILGAIALVPKARDLYDRSLEKRLDSYTLSELGKDAALGTASTTAQVPLGVSNEGEEADDFNGEGGEGASVRVGNSEIWRFNLKTDSPTEIQPKIVQALQAQGLSSSTPGISGTLAPGGVQFDLLVPKGMVANLKTALQRIANSAVEDGQGSSFTWYKNQSKKEIPPGKSRVVIWLSQT